LSQLAVTEISVGSDNFNGAGFMTRSVAPGSCLEWKLKLKAEG
jgi:hypothetical protein